MARNVKPPSRSQLRIIGGEWRSRRIEFAGDGSIRPTPDRLRETLFNWLMPMLDGARCLDLFAGSGALGLEALSRGASHCTFIERDARHAEMLRQSLKLLGGGDRASVYSTDAGAFLAQAINTYDLVFIDPPYQQQLIETILPALPARLSADHRVFVEHAVGETLHWPTGWDVLKTTRVGIATAELLCYTPAAT